MSLITDKYGYATLMNELEIKKRAAVIAALGLCRGMLYSINMGDFNPKDIEAVLSATALSNFADALGLTESDLAIDVREVLSQEILDKIRPHLS